MVNFPPALSASYVKSADFWRNGYWAGFKSGGHIKPPRLEGRDVGTRVSIALDSQVIRIPAHEVQVVVNYLLGKSNDLYEGSVMTLYIEETDLTY